MKSNWLAGHLRICSGTALSLQGCQPGKRVYHGLGEKRITRIAKFLTYLAGSGLASPVQSARRRQAREPALVESAGGDRDLFVQAANDAHNLWPGNPALPVSGLALGATALALAGFGGLALRKRSG